VVLEGIWPDPVRKRERADALVDLAERIILSEDRDASVEAVRAELTATAHWLLLGNGVFPLSRDELADQVLDLGSFDLAAALHRSIHDQPCLDELASGVRLVRHALGLTPQRAPLALACSHGSLSDCPVGPPSKQPYGSDGGWSHDAHPAIAISIQADG
jgi:hypothetical protein